MSEELKKQVELPSEIGCTITDIVVAISVVCQCPEHKTVLVPLLTTADAFGQCSACGVRFRVARMNYDRQKPGDFTAAIESSIPKLVRPASLAEMPRRSM